MANHATPSYETTALFPLPDAVLFPHTTLPLHIFEPRYRTMTEQVLQEDGYIALATLDEEQPDSERGPAYHEICGLGRISDVQPLTGGRYLIFLEGMARMLVVDELDVETPYRQVRGLRLDERLENRPEANLLIQSIRGSLLSLDHRGIDGAEQLNIEVGLLDSPSAIADMVGSALYPDTDRKRQLFEELDVLCRLRRVERRLSRLIVQAYEHNPPDLRERN